MARNDDYEGEWEGSGLVDETDEDHAAKEASVKELFTLADEIIDEVTEVFRGHDVDGSDADILLTKLAAAAFQMGRLTAIVDGETEFPFDWRLQYVEQLGDIGISL